MIDLSGRLLDFTVEVIKVVNTLPETVPGRHVAKQMTRAGTSCGANYEEACGAESRPDFIHKMGIVLKELKETRYWLRLIRKTGLLSPTRTGSVMDECEQLCAIIAKSIITAKTKKKYHC
ncbi:MAG TPA: four helix bundle protein [Thermodesulfobacteriota bacterium]|nr:four helix bundle protein [Thermodesulfobacteriota bacterium]